MLYGLGRVTGASGYQLFKDGVLLTTITATTYTLFPYGFNNDTFFQLLGLL